MTMLLIAFLGAASIFLLGIGIFSDGAVSDDNVAKRLGEIQDEPGGRKYQNNIDFRKLFSALFSPIKNKTAEKGAKGAKVQRKVSPKTEAFEKMLRYAGLNMNAAQFNYVRYGAAFGLGLLGAIMAFVLNLSGQNKLLLIVFCLVLGAYVPTKLLSNRVSKKKFSIQRELPDIMDLLVVSVEAGLGFDSALIRLWDKNKGPVMQELMQTIRDVHHGASKKEAYSDLIKRCDCKEMTSFANAVIQAEQLGISMKSVLTAQSESLRKDRMRRAQIMAEKAPVKMMIPMVIFIFPTIFIILLAPAAVNIVTMMGGS